MAHICPHCQIGFKEFVDYSEHIRSNHMKDALKTKAEAIRMRPTRTSARSKARIVNDMEKTWGANIFPEIKPWQGV